MTKLPMVCVHIKPGTKAYEEAYSSGRLAIYQIDGQPTPILCAVVYGWTGAVKGNEASDRTDDLLQILKDELNCQHVGPHCICGDVNGDLEACPQLQDVVSTAGWTDVGKHANMWGGIPDQPTCRVSAASKANRRDYFFVNEFMRPAVKSFTADQCDTFPTHCPVQLCLATGNWAPCSGGLGSQTMQLLRYKR